MYFCLSKFQEKKFSSSLFPEQKKYYNRAYRYELELYIARYYVKTHVTGKIKRLSFCAARTRRV